MVKHWHILSYFLFTPWFILIWIALTVTNTFSAYVIDFHVGWINLGTFGAALSIHCSGHSRSYIYHCVVLYQIQHLPRSCLCSHLDYPSSHSSWANFRCPKGFQVHYRHYFRLNDSWFFWYGGHSLFDFVLQGGSLRAKLGAKVIFVTI